MTKMERMRWQWGIRSSIAGARFSDGWGDLRERLRGYLLERVKWYLRPSRLLEMSMSRHSCGVPTPMNLHRLQTSINSTHDLVVVSLPEAAISSVNMDTMSSVGRRAVGEVSRVPAEGPRDDSIVRIM